jgi:hypothetical protein
VRRDGLGEMLDEDAGFAHLGGGGLVHGLRLLHRGLRPALDRGDAAAELGHLARQIGDSICQIGDLAAVIVDGRHTARHRV